jgi:hypothetical protein
MDIVARLRVFAEFKNRNEKLDSLNIMHEAAAEIELLRNERDLLWEELAAARNSLAGLGYPNIASIICDAALKEGE